MNINRFEDLINDINAIKSNMMCIRLAIRYITDPIRRIICDAQTAQTIDKVGRYYKVFIGATSDFVSQEICYTINDSFRLLTNHEVEPIYVDFFKQELTEDALIDWLKREAMKKSSKEKLKDAVKRMQDSYIELLIGYHMKVYELLDYYIEYISVEYVFIEKEEVFLQRIHIPGEKNVLYTIPEDAIELTTCDLANNTEFKTELYPCDKIYRIKDEFVPSSLANISKEYHSTYWNQMRELILNWHSECRAYPEFQKMCQSSGRSKIATRP